jgi:hypothetical protein
MDRNNKFVGREKNVSGKTGSINKVGSGRGKTQSQRGSSSGGPVGGGRGPSRAGGIAKLSPLAIVVIIAYMLFGGGGGNTQTTSTAVNTGNQSTHSSQSGSGAQSSSFYDYFVSGAGQNSASGSSSSSSGGAGSYGSNGYYTQPAATVDNNTGSVDTVVSNKARDKFTKLLGNGRDTVTLMVYMCGTDLESNYAMATNDLQEMLKADLDTDRVKIIVYTGGCRRWKNSVFSNSKNEIYQVVKGGVERLSNNEGNVPMTDPSTLSGFIRWCKDRYPASRYDLILWDHGGGTLSGFGNDEKFPGTTMSLEKIAEALRDGGVKFDFIGFDACLMATLENAMTVEPYADYLIASEETEPGYGWYYTTWLSQLSSNPSMDTLSLGKTICDTFTSDNAKRTRGDSTTLSVIDLAEAAGTVPEALDAFASTLNDNIRGDQYLKIANARSATLEFASSTKIDQIDLIDFCTRIDSKESKAFADTLRGIIKYNRTSSNFRSAYGIAAYFPYRRISYTDKVLSTLGKANYNQNYTTACKSFASLVTGGQISAGGSSSPLYSLFGNGYSSLGSSSGSSYGSSGSSGSSGSYYDYSSYGGSNGSAELVGELLNMFLSTRSIAPGMEVNGLTEENSSWLDTDLIKDKADYLASTTIDASQLVWTDKNGEQALVLSDETWDLIEKIELSLYYDDGEGYLDLGTDNIIQFDDDGDFIGTWDGTWIALDDLIAPYYVVLATMDEDNSYTVIGRVPAILNDETDCNIIVKFTSEDPKGSVVGISTIQNYEKPEEILGKIEPIDDPELAGSKLTFASDYYTYDLEFIDQYETGNALTIDPEHDIEITNGTVDKADTCKAMYKITDIYANEFWTEPLPTP